MEDETSRIVPTPCWCLTSRQPISAFNQASRVTVVDLATSSPARMLNPEQQIVNCLFAFRCVLVHAEHPQGGRAAFVWSVVGMRHHEARKPESIRSQGACYVCLACCGTAGWRARGHSAKPSCSRLNRKSSIVFEYSAQGFSIR